MTRERLVEIQIRTAAATAGPWLCEVDEAQTHASHAIQFVMVTGGAGTDKRMLYSRQHPYGDARGLAVRLQDIADGAFIAHARRDVPDLLARIAELEVLTTQFDAKDGNGNGHNT